jgi:hypothetical protein
MSITSSRRTIRRQQKARRRTRRVLVVAEARLELVGAGVSVRRGVVRAPHPVENVLHDAKTHIRSAADREQDKEGCTQTDLAEVRSVGVRRVASLDAEGVCAHELPGMKGGCQTQMRDKKRQRSAYVVPLDDLGGQATGLGVGIRVDQGSYRVTAAIGTVGVQLSAGVVGHEVDEGLVDDASDLNVSGRAHELHALESTLGDDAGPVAFLGAPGYSLALGVGNVTVWRR